MKGEIQAQLDSPRALAMDAYCHAMYGNLYYGNSMTKILENLDSITKEEVINAFDYILNNSKKSLAIVGDFEKSEIMPQIAETIGKHPVSTDNNFDIEKPELKEAKEVINTKSDLNQAHIIKGWQVPT